MEDDLFAENTDRNVTPTMEIEEKEDDSKSEEKISKDYRRFVPFDGANV